MGERLDDIQVREDLLMKSPQIRLGTGKKYRKKGRAGRGRKSKGKDGLGGGTWSTHKGKLVFARRPDELIDHGKRLHTAPGGQSTNTRERRVLNDRSACGSRRKKE